MQGLQGEVQGVQGQVQGVQEHKAVRVEGCKGIKDARAMSHAILGARSAKAGVRGARVGARSASCTMVSKGVTGTRDVRHLVKFSLHNSLYCFCNSMNLFHYRKWEMIK